MLFEGFIITNLLRPESLKVDTGCELHWSELFTRLKQNFLNFSVKKTGHTLKGYLMNPYLLHRCHWLSNSLLCVISCLLRTHRLWITGQFVVKSWYDWCFSQTSQRNCEWCLWTALVWSCPCIECCGNRFFWITEVI